MTVTQHSVVIAGGGPTGLMLAGELALAGVDVAIVERREDQALDGSRAKGLHARSLEVLDQRGIVDRFVAAGQQYPALGFAGATLDITDLPTRHNYVLGLPQREFEPILADWVVKDLGVPILRGRDVVDLRQDDGGVDVDLSDGTSLRAAHLVGCDGGRSAVRRAAGIEVVGSDATTSWMIAEVELDGQAELGLRHDRVGTHALAPAGDGAFGVVLTERELERSRTPTTDDLRGALVEVYDTDFGLRTVRWISRFTDRTMQAVDYRRGRVLLAGDAAHVHPPQGGQGLNTGLQDAVNLGWKLAQVVQGIAPDSLLDTYHAERHPVGARVLHNTLAQVALGRTDERSVALRETVAELFAMDGPRRSVAGMLTGLDVRYDLGDGHPLLGRRMPDLDLRTAEGACTVFSLLHDARPVLLDLDGSTSVDLGPGVACVRHVDATCDGSWEVPVIGEVEAPSAVLVRPDGHVAWVGETTDPDLGDALTRWCGDGRRGRP